MVSNGYQVCNDDNGISGIISALCLWLSSCMVPPGLNPLNLASVVASTQLEKSAIAGLWYQ